MDYNHDKSNKIVRALSLLQAFGVALARKIFSGKLTRPLRALIRG